MLLLPNPPPPKKIIARIQTPHKNIKRNISDLLADVGKHHPQALIYPLTVASKSSSKSRRNAALAIMDRMREHSQTIVNQVKSSFFHAKAGILTSSQALLVSQELIRVAILWHELWHEGLEEASRHFFTEKNPEGMIQALEPLHDLLDTVQSFQGRPAPLTHLSRALPQRAKPHFIKCSEENCMRLEKLVVGGVHMGMPASWIRLGTYTMGRVSSLRLCSERTIDFHEKVFKKVEKQLPQLTTLDLQYVSPRLLKAKSLELAVPGKQ